MWTKRFWKRTAERMLRAAAAAMAAVLGVTETTSDYSQVTIDFAVLGKAGIIGAFVSLLFSVMAAPANDDPDSPSFIR